MTTVKIVHPPDGTELTPAILKESLGTIAAAATNIQADQLAEDFVVDAAKIKNAVPRSGGECDEIFCDSINGINVTDLDQIVRMVNASLLSFITVKAEIVVDMLPNTGAAGAQLVYTVLGGNGEATRTLRIDAPPGFSGLTCIPLLNNHSVVKFAPGGFVRIGKPVHNQDYVEYPIEVGGSNSPWGIQKKYTMQVLFYRIGAK